MSIEETIKKAIEGGYGMLGWKNYQELIVGQHDDPQAKDGFWNVYLHWKGNNQNILSRKIMVERIFLDPKFWQSLGKALGWKNQLGSCPLNCECEGGIVNCGWKGESWLYYWHRFTDHLAEEKPIEEFFKEL
ncbi:MAG: hypothetical protein KJI72_00095 [Patescibacteria group bacterium]|nr:hypothetical protein [Patescibacteria group bacterium]